MGGDTIERKIITRAEAKALGLKFYFTGKKCIREHVSERYTTTGKCLTCTQIDYIENKEMHLEKCKKWREENKQADIERRRKYREKNRQKAKQDHENWRNKNRERLRKYWRNWRKENLEKERNRNKIYTKNNPLIVKIANARRRARKLNAEGKYLKNDILNLLSLQKEKCNACDTNISQFYHIDHIIPLSKGGSNWPWNIQLLCPDCNFSKANKDYEEWKKLRFKCE